MEQKRNSMLAALLMLAVGSPAVAQPAVISKQGNDANVAAYLSPLGARRSKLGIDERRKLIKACLPVWIFAGKYSGLKAEQYFPMPFQMFKKYHVEHGIVTKDGSLDLIPQTDNELYQLGSLKNLVPPAENLITSPRYAIEDHILQSLAPTSMPTYAFYQEQENGEIWIRYFLFFGYNHYLKYAGDHVADWVHVSVALSPSGKSYRPSTYFFSAHGGGETYDASDPALKFFVGGRSSVTLSGDGGPSFDRLTLDTHSFRNLPEEGPFHVRVFLAAGSHEAYAGEGLQVMPNRDEGKLRAGAKITSHFAWVSGCSSVSAALCVQSALILPFAASRSLSPWCSSCAPVGL